MKTLATDKNNDIYMSTRGLAMVDGAKAQCVLLESLLKTQLGELQFDDERGIDYFGTVFQSPNYLSMWATEVKSQVRKFSWVKKIESFDYTFDREANTVVWSMTVLNTDDERILMSWPRDKRNGSVLEVAADWEDILNKPAGLDEILARVNAMRKAAGEKSYITTSDTVGTVKKVVNDVVLTPLKSDS